MDNRWDENLRTISFVAIRFADVFGGMGSGNDQYVEHDQEKLELVSAELFDAIKKIYQIHCRGG